MSKTWPIVMEFARAMEHKLSENKHKGDQEGWRSEGFPFLLHCIDIERRELIESIKQDSLEEGQKECADIANFAMMIYDKLEQKIKDEVAAATGE